MSPFQDHPSVGLLSEKLLDNHIYSVFAVEKQQYQWYEVMSPTHVRAPVYRSAHICEQESKRFRPSWGSEDRDQTPALPRNSLYCSLGMLTSLEFYRNLQRYHFKGTNVFLPLPL